jgi:hydrogenase expression/formation protein HypD
METLMTAPDCRVEGFLAAGHVCTVTGFGEYDYFVQLHQTPVVVTGFEPVDLLGGILDCVTQLEEGRAAVTNQYTRSVDRSGNEASQDIVGQVYEVADTLWRGLGVIPSGGYRLRPEFQSFDAAEQFSGLVSLQAVNPDSRPDDECRSGDVLSGRLKPIDCPAFGTRCTPESPLGAPMVSSEGACAAYFRYQSLTN